MPHDPTSDGGLGAAVDDYESRIDRVLGVLDEFRAWMHSEAHDGCGGRRWGVQHVLDHYDERTSGAICDALTNARNAR